MEDKIMMQRNARSEWQFRQQMRMELSFEKSLDDYLLVGRFFGFPLEITYDRYLYNIQISEKEIIRNEYEYCDKIQFLLERGFFIRKIGETDFSVFSDWFEKIEGSFNRIYSIFRGMNSKAAEYIDAGKTNLICENSELPVFLADTFLKLWNEIQKLIPSYLNCYFDNDKMEVVRQRECARYDTENKLNNMKAKYLVFNIQRKTVDFVYDWKEIETSLQFPTFYTFVIDGDYDCEYGKFENRLLSMEDLRMVIRDAPFKNEKIVGIGDSIIFDEIFRYQNRLQRLFKQLNEQIECLQNTMPLLMKIRGDDSDDEFLENSNSLSELQNALYYLKKLIPLDFDIEIKK